MVSPEGNLNPIYRLEAGLRHRRCRAADRGLCPVLVGLLTLTITTRGKPFFVQERVGPVVASSDVEVPTMVVNAEALQHPVSNEKDGPVFKNRRDPRITRLAPLRSTSLDELPQLFNAEGGDGPGRPARRWPRKCQEPGTVSAGRSRPDSACGSRVAARSGLKTAKMDLWYVENQNLRTDLQRRSRPAERAQRRGAY